MIFALDKTGEESQSENLYDVIKPIFKDHSPETRMKPRSISVIDAPLTAASYPVKPRAHTVNEFEALSESPFLGRLPMPTRMLAFAEPELPDILNSLQRPSISPRKGSVPVIPSFTKEIASKTRKESCPIFTQPFVMPNRNALENWKEEEGEREPEAEGDYLAPSEIKTPRNQKNIKKVTQQHQDLSYMKPLPCLPGCSASLPGQEMLESPATDMEMKEVNEEDLGISDDYGVCRNEERFRYKRGE